jgi:hypothetical protein
MIFPYASAVATEMLKETRCFYLRHTFRSTSLTFPPPHVVSPEIRVDCHEILLNLSTYYNFG